MQRVLLSGALALTHAAIVSAQELTERQIEQVVRRGEQLLVAGKPEQALRATRNLSAAFMAEGALQAPCSWALLNRAVVVSATGVVRLNGHDPSFPAADPLENLRQAEQRLRELLQAPEPSASVSTPCPGADASARKPAHWRSRHAEALVALQRSEEAYAVLAPMLVSKTLSEAEGAAALARVALELGHKEVSVAASQHCKQLAPKRAKQVCKDPALASSPVKR
jgi:hypothetical protein